jgi:tetratricopeptide (TPR) repeat protein
VFRIPSTALAVLLVAVVAAVVPAAAQTRSFATPSPTVIADPNEYAAYQRAAKLTDPAQQAAAMDAFAAKYPTSVALIDALQTALTDYDRLGQHDRVEATANRILRADPDNVRALAIAVTFLRAHAVADPTQSPQLLALAKRGIVALATWPRPAGVTQADFTKLVLQMRELFYGAEGFALLQTRDFLAAQQAYLQALQVNSADETDVYELGVTDLAMTPLDADGFWYIAKAAALSKPQNAAAADKIEAYGRAQYRAYHGTDADWPTLVAATVTGVAPAETFAASITPAPAAAK